VHWFLRIARSQLVSLLYTSQLPDRPDMIKPDLGDAIWGDARAFYDISGTMHVVLARTPAELPSTNLFGVSIKAMIPRDSWLAEKLAEDRLVRATLAGTDELDRFVIPQAVYSWLKHDEPIFWDFDDVVVGIA